MFFVEKLVRKVDSVRTFLPEDFGLGSSLFKFSGGISVIYRRAGGRKVF